MPKALVYSDKVLTFRISFFATTWTSCHTGCLALNATTVSFGFARPSSLSGTLLNASEYDYTKWFPIVFFPKFNVPDLGCSNKFLSNWMGSEKNLSLAFHVLLFRQKRTTQHRALFVVSSSCEIAGMPSFQSLPRGVLPFSQPFCLFFLVFWGIVTSFLSLPPN